MSMVLCLTDDLSDSEAWITHLHMRGYETMVTDLKSLSTVSPDQWQRSGLLLSQSAAKTLAGDGTGFAAHCRRRTGSRYSINRVRPSH